MVYQFGLLAQGQFSAWTVVAFAVLAGMVYLLFRKGYQGESSRLRAVDAVSAS